MKLLALLATAVLCGNEPDVPMPDGAKPVDNPEELADMVDGVIDEKLYTIRLPYLSVFIPDVLKIMGELLPDEPAGLKSVDMVKLNTEWIEKQKADEKKPQEHTKMINIPFTMPMTPHGVFKFMEGSDFCWVLMFYDSDQHDPEAYHIMAENLAGYFKERCMVGTVNIAYPANKATFGRLVKGYPSLAIRKGGWETKMLSGKIVDKSFELSNIDEWGFLVGKEEMSDENLAATLKKILTEVYEPMNEFQKMHAIYTPWYNTKDIKKFHKEVMSHVLDARFKDRDAAGAKPPNKSEMMEYLYKNPDAVREVLLKEGLLTVPAPLPKLHDRYFDEL